MNKLYVLYIDNKLYMLDNNFNQLNYPITSLTFSMNAPTKMMNINICMLADIIKEEWNGTLEEWVQSKKLENL